MPMEDLSVRGQTTSERALHNIMAAKPQQNKQTNTHTLPWALLQQKKFLQKMRNKARGSAYPKILREEQGKGNPWGSQQVHLQVFVYVNWNIN